MEKVTLEQAWLWLGDRGIHVNFSDIKVSGKWAFVRTKDYYGVPNSVVYHDEFAGKTIWRYQVDCYDVLSGSLWAEPEDCIRYDLSPFIPGNQERTAAVIAQLEQDQEPDTDKLCLIAVEGDMAKGGMGDTNDVIPFEPEHNGLVKAFLEAQLAFRMESAFQDSKGNHDMELISSLCYIQDQAGYALREAGVFRHKYDQRTTWELAYMGELDEIERYKPFVIESYKGGE